MQTAQPSLFAREDTIFGACEGIGEDFGFNAQYLRVVLAGLLFWNPLAAVGSYAVLAAAVFIARKVALNRPAGIVAPAVPAITELKGENDAQPVELAVAA